MFIHQSPTRAVRSFALITSLSISIIVNSQEVIKDVVNTTTKVNTANNVANSATNALSNTKNTVSNVKNVVGSIFKKKKKSGENEKTQLLKPVKLTIFSISNIDYASLKVLEDSIRTIEGVANTKKTYAEGQSTLEVNYTGEADELWDIIAEALKNTFLLKAIAGQKIDLEFKKPF